MHSAPLWQQQKMFDVPLRLFAALLRQSDPGVDFMYCKSSGDLFYTHALPALVSGTSGLQRCREPVFYAEPEELDVLKFVVWLALFIRDVKGGRVELEEEEAEAEVDVFAEVDELMD